MVFIPRQLPLLFSVLVLALLMFGGANAAEEHDYEGFVSQRIRTRAFEKVKMHADVGRLHAASDPNYIAHRQAIRLNQLALTGREISEVREDGSYTVTYSDHKIISYTAAGKTEAAGSINQDGFPQKVVLYHYPSGKLKTVMFRLSPKDIYVFNAAGELVQGATETVLWERLTYEKRVAAIGLNLLTANRIKEKVSFRVEQNHGTVNASSSEMFNQVSVNRGLLAYIENDDELAAVLAHELAHIILRHRHIYPVPTHDELLQKRFRIPAVPRRDTYEYGKSQEKELDADRMGLRMMVKAGYQPEATISVLQKITSDGSESAWSTHPSGSHRIQAIQQQIRTLRAEKSNSFASTDIPVIQSNGDASELRKMLPADKVVIRHWNWQKAQAELLKYNPAKDIAEANWAQFPKQDPEHSMHMKVLQKHIAIAGHSVLYQEATGLYAKLLQDSQHGIAQYSVRYPGARAYLVFHLSGRMSQVALCNRVAIPRVCQLLAMPADQMGQRLFEITETDAFIFNADNSLTGFRLNGGLYNLQGQRMAILQIYQ